MNEYLAEGENLIELSPIDRETFFQLALLSNTKISHTVLWADEIKAQNQGLRVQARFISKTDWVNSPYWNFMSDDILYRIHPNDVHKYI